MAEAKDIFELRLHEKTTLGDGTEVLRVVKGWIYTMRFHRLKSNDFAVTSTFVPAPVTP